MSLSQFATVADYMAAQDQKITVHYVPMVGDFIEVDHRASVYAVDHYRLGEGLVNTSGVLSYDADTGVFETYNTIYKPLDTQAQAVV